MFVEVWGKDIGGLSYKDYMILNIFYTILKILFNKFCNVLKIILKPSKVVLTKFNGQILEKES